MLGVIRDVLEDEEASEGAKLRALKAAVGVESKEAELQLVESQLGRPTQTPEFDTREESVSALVSKMRANPLLAQQMRAVLSAAELPEGNPPDSE
jgi:hypothetical protein